MTTRLLSPEDIYDTYGLDWVLSTPEMRLDEEDEQIITTRLREIQAAYVHACTSRIKAEAAYLGILDADNLSLSAILAKVRENIATNIQSAMERNAEHMMRGGRVNVMAEILKSHQAAGSREIEGVDLSRFGVQAMEPVKPPSVDPNWFMDCTNKNDRVVNDPKWAEIAKAYVAVEQAHQNLDITKAIDRLNQLQHNSFHVLIDLQTGRMLNDYSNATEDRDARKRLQEVLDIKLKARGPGEFASKMSKDVQKLLKKYRRTSTVPIR